MSRDPRLFLADIVARADRAIRARRGRSFDQFTADEDAVDVVVLGVQVIGEAVKRVPDAIRDRAPGVAWHDAARMRDRLIHRYWEVDVTVVWGVLTRELPLLRDGVAALIAVLDAESPPPSA